MRRIQLELRACKDKLAEIPQNFFILFILLFIFYFIFDIITHKDQPGKITVYQCRTLNEYFILILKIGDLDRLDLVSVWYETVVRELILQDRPGTYRKIKSCFDIYTFYIAWTSGRYKGLFSLDPAQFDNGSQKG